MIILSQTMETVGAKEFYEDFLRISQSLTLTELQMLYILITEPEAIELSQQAFADKLGTHLS